MSRSDEITELINSQNGAKTKGCDQDILKDLGVYADDFTDFLEKFAEKYVVDMSEYLWYFHNEEEGQNFGAIFFKPPYMRVERIPVTIRMLAEFSESQKWKIDYPEHIIPEKRTDIMMNRIFYAIVTGIIILLVIHKYVL